MIFFGYRAARMVFYPKVKLMMGQFESQKMIRRAGIFTDKGDPTRSLFSFRTPGLGLYFLKHEYQYASFVNEYVAGITFMDRLMKVGP